MAQPVQARELHGAVLMENFEVTVKPGNVPGLFIPIPHPHPGVVIHVLRVVIRVHIVSPRDPFLYATTLVLLRASDNTLMGGVATPITRSPGPIAGYWTLGKHDPLVPSEHIAEREYNFVPDFYVITAADSMTALFQTWQDVPNPIGEAAFQAKLSIAIVYTLV